MLIDNTMEFKVGIQEEIDAVVKGMTARYTKQLDDKEITKEEFDELIGYVHLWAERHRQGKPH